MSLRGLLLAVSICCSLAAPTGPRASSPQVAIQNGVVVGSSFFGVDSFKGIPYALPPTGTRRLRPPTPITTPFGTITATGVPNACPQMLPLSIDTMGFPTEVINLLDNTPFNGQSLLSSEDCLTINVQRPSNIEAGTKLPVVFWMYGGGFEVGSTSMYDGAGFVQESVSLGAPVVYVAVNYRVAAFGFLGGKEMQADGSTNLGLRDQRLGLEWVADNIEAFGGDSDRVTLWGESAGSFSGYDHALINRGNNTYKGKALFRGAILNSGTAIPSTDVASSKPQAVYDAVVEAAGCPPTNSLQCLRSVPYLQLFNAQNTIPGIFSYHSLDVRFLPRYDPSDDFFPISPGKAGRDGQNVAVVPFIIGDQEDEGTLFSLSISNVTTADDLITYLMEYFQLASRSQIETLVNSYPGDPSSGSPFRTSFFNEIYPGFKRNAAVLGDLVFTLSRRVVLGILKRYYPDVPVWSYLSSYNYGTPILGTNHGSDLLPVYFGLPGSVTRRTHLTYYISFVNFLDPNRISTNYPLIPWPQWQLDDRKLLNLLPFSNQIITDDFRDDSAQIIDSLIDVLAI